MADEEILVVDDDPELRKLVSTYLQSEGFRIRQAADGAEALRMWEERRPDLIVLDWMMPRLSGLDVARQVRQRDATPIVMLTARDEEPDMLIGLELGADDYLTKPFSMRELVARIRAVLRRTRPQAVAAAEVLRFGPVSIDVGAHVVRRDGAEIPLTGTEMKLLMVLAQNPNRVLSRMQLVESAIGDYFDGFERTVDSHISHIRQKLGVEGLLQTVKGVGYKLVPPKG